MTPIQLTVFVVNSGAKNADLNRTINAFSRISPASFWGMKKIECLRNIRFVSVKDLSEARDKMGTIISLNLWHLVVYDNELPDSGFLDNLSGVLVDSKADVLVVYKRGKGALPTKSIRLYRSGHAVSSTSLLPFDSSARVEHFWGGFLLGVPVV